MYVLQHGEKAALGDASRRRSEPLRQVFMKGCREVQSRGGKLVYPFAAFFVAAETVIGSFSAFTSAPGSVPPADDPRRGCLPR